MTKVAKLVTATLTIRVIVKEGATYEQIMDAATPKFIQSIQTDLGEHVDEIFDDLEAPYNSDEEHDDDVVAVKDQHNNFIVNASRKDFTVFSLNPNNLFIKKWFDNRTEYKGYTLFINDKEIMSKI